MRKQAKRVCQILQDNYLDVWKVKIDDVIIEADKGIDYLVDEPNKAIRVTLGITTDKQKYLEESLCEIINYVSDFRIILIEEIKKEILGKYQEVTCLFVF